MIRKMFDIRELNNFNTMPEAFLAISHKYPTLKLYSQAQISEDGSRKWISRSYSEVEKRVLSIANFLRSLGVKKGTKVAIISSSRPEWIEADMAILLLGGISVSVYQSLLAEDIGYILYDSGAEIAFAENQEQVDKLYELSESEITIPATEERAETKANVKLNSIITFEEVNSKLESQYFEEVIRDTDALEVNDYKDCTRGDFASFVYTSGTTGPPKGVMQSHGNHLSNARQAGVSGLLDFSREIEVMLFLPLAHSFAKLIGVLGLLTPLSINFPGIADKKSSKADPVSITRDIRESNSTLIPIVPRLLEKMQSGIIAKSKNTGVLGKLLKIAISSANAKYIGQGHGLISEIQFRLTSFLRKKIKKQLFGANFNFCISGGAKLNPDVAKFFDSLEIGILEGYGLTETCVVTNVNVPNRKKIGTVGTVVDSDLEIKLAEDKEIMFKGPNIAHGYYNRKKATEASWDSDGWFHTGDLGEIDKDGFLSIVGRKKEIIVTSYGKNIVPIYVEGFIQSTELVSQAMLVGDGRAFCSVLVTLDIQAVKAWAKRTGISLEKEYDKDKKVITKVTEDIKKVSEESLSNYEQPKKVLICPEDFTIENGMMTPTFKVKRKSILQKYSDLINNLY